MFDRHCHSILRRKDLRLRAQPFADLTLRLECEA